MRILYFSNKPIGLKEKLDYNGGGWIMSLINEIRKTNIHEIAIAYFASSDKIVNQDNIVLYQLRKKDNHFRLKKYYYSIITLFGDLRVKEEISWNYYLKKLNSIVLDFKPDIIHVFGSEMQFGLVRKITRIPVVLHIQGLINPIVNAFLPPFVSWSTIRKIHSPIENLHSLYLERKLKMDAYRELEIFRNVDYFIGRTQFDKAFTFCVNPNAFYYYGAEILRPIFYEKSSRINPKKMTIISTISSPLYKGLDNILKTAFVLKEIMGFDFIWKIYGNVNPKQIENLIKIKHQDINIKLMGVVVAEELRKSLLSSTCYVHLSHIDNSPNGLCEAQILGIPVVATNVGGISSLINNGENGYLVPDNDPYQTSFYIKQLFMNRNLNENIGLKAKQIASERHDRNQIVDQLLKTYNDIINKEL